AEEVGPKRLTHRQFTVLLAVDQNEGASQTDLVRITGIDRSTLADLIGRMTANGLLQRRRTKSDARTNTVKLSAAGRRALSAAQPGAHTADRRLLRAMDSNRRRVFIDALAELNRVLSEQETKLAQTARRKRKS
ncbi:MAG: MarR family transcriptional regulator, partial [Pseudomonadota bacterium]